MRAFIGLGSNLGDRLENLRRALAALNRGGAPPVAVSSVYETEPVGPPQPEFLNAVCEVSTDLAALDLFHLLKSVEAEVGRTAGERWGPREIDLDLLLFGAETVDEEELKVPHPEVGARAFVLVPLLEIFPEATLPSGEPLSAKGSSPAGVRKFAPPSALLY